MESLFKSDAEVKSSLAFLKFPALRDHPRHTGDIWLKGKRIDDELGNLWRIHDGLYDFSEFASIHPGGQDWIDLTRGTDITEAFEAHHIRAYPETLLKIYFVEQATTPRNSPFTFHEDGFYKTLKRRVRKVLKDVPQEASKISDKYADGTLAAYVVFAMMAAQTDSYIIAAIAGLFLSMTTIIAHNYFHRKDNFRMYYFDLSLMSSRSWRITHALSHHIYTNTVYDYEISFVEPFFQYLPMEKPLLVRYGSWFYGPVVFALTFIASYIRMLLQVHEDGLHTFRKEALLPFIIPILMYLTSHRTVIEVAILFGIIAIAGGTHFSTVGINAAHHHPKIFHDGDKPRSETLDWGLHELDTVAERSDINWSHYLVITNFGEHSLHHLFPTLDHGMLKYLHPLVMEVCKEFDAEIRERTQLKLMAGQYLQLARVKPSESYADRSSSKSKRNQKG